MDVIEKEQYYENKYHSTTEFPYNTYVCTIPLDFPTVPIHWHEDLEMIVIKKGAGLVTLNLTKYKVAAGDIIVVLPGNLHSIDAISDTMEYENILLKKELVESTTNDLTQREYLEPFFCGKFNIEVKISSKLVIYNDFINVIEYLDTLCDDKGFGYHLAVKSAVLQLIYLLITNQTREKEMFADDKYIEKLKSIIMYISTHYYEVITIDEIAEFCGYSSSHFMKFFKQHTGTSFISFLNDYRVSEAKNLLATTDYTILEISEKCGFSNLSNFNRIFKKKYGVVPSKLR